MQQDHADFYKRLRAQIRGYLEGRNFKYGDLLLLAPDFFHLLVKLMLDRRIPVEKKLKLSAAIAYFITPLDFLPEAILGPLGFMDDLALAAYILNDFINTQNMDIIYEHWAGETDNMASIQNVLTGADYFLGRGLLRRISKKFGLGK